MKRIIGFTCGSFDLPHAGHMRMFKECKKVCTYLIIGLQTDPTLDRAHKHTPIMSIEERYEILSACRYIDKILIYDTEEALYKLLKKIKPDIRIIGEDWKNKQYTGCDLPTKIYFNSRKHNFSTSELRNRVYEAEKKIREDKNGK